MWKSLPEKQREEYKRLILSFASLSEVFAQKVKDDSSQISPIINSKFQETVFQKSFHASAEDIGNTSFDAAVNSTNLNDTKYLVGIKTFGISSRFQKVAQFKANHDEWTEIMNQITNNSFDANKKRKSKKEIDNVNKKLYLELARQIAVLRNKRIKSSQENIRGFNNDKSKSNIESVYHVLMSSRKKEQPAIYVGETTYDLIKIDDISIKGCTSKDYPTYFLFNDGNHEYKFTSADSQLWMNFNNKKIIIEKWDVIYADDVYEIFSNIADKIYGKKENISNVVESYSWKIELHTFSGFNSFYGVGPKMEKSQRKKRINNIRKKYKDTINESIFNEIMELLSNYLLSNSSTSQEKYNKVQIRNRILEELKNIDNEKFKKELLGVIYRPLNEMYIPIPNANIFHLKHPHFFGSNIGTFKNDNKSLLLPHSEREFNLIFEPSGDSIRAYITQDYGKAIQSVQKQSYLGEWILRKIFQLEEFELLTEDKLDKIGINGIRLYKLKNSNDIHLEFIWIDEENLPQDYCVF